MNRDPLQLIVNVLAVLAVMILLGVMLDAAVTGQFALVPGTGN